MYIVRLPSASSFRSGNIGELMRSPMVSDPERLGVWEISLVEMQGVIRRRSVKRFRPTGREILTSLGHFRSINVEPLARPLHVYRTSVHAWLNFDPSAGGVLGGLIQQDRSVVIEWNCPRDPDAIRQSQFRQRDNGLFCSSCQNRICGP
jgi:hypothetical protein